MKFSLQNTQGAETQYTWLCKILKWLKTDASGGNISSIVDISDVIKRINTEDLFLFSKKKTLASEEYKPESKIDIDTLPALLCTRHCAAFMYNLKYVAHTVICDFFTTAYDDPSHTVLFSCGAVTFYPDESSIKLGKHLIGLVNILKKPYIPYAIPKNDQQNAEDTQLAGLSAYMYGARYLTKPTTIVIKEEEMNKKKQLLREKRLNKAIDTGNPAWLNNRDIHYILDPDEMHELLITQHKHLGGTHAPPRPHKRKKHVRVLRSPRYKNARGKIIPIGEMEVGVKPGEKITLPKSIYHVVSIGGKKS